MREPRIAKSVKLETYQKTLVRLYGPNKSELNFKNMKKELNKYYLRIGENILKENK